MYIYFLASSEKYNVQVKNCYGYLFDQLEEKVGAKCYFNIWSHWTREIKTFSGL